MRESKFTKHKLRIKGTIYDTWILQKLSVEKFEIYEMSLVLIVLHKTTVVKVLTLSREYKRYTKFRVCSDDC